MTAVPARARQGPTSRYRTRSPTERGDTGSGTVLVLTVAALVVLTGTVLAALAAVTVARHRAAAAADLAALAAAQASHRGAGPACATAERVAAAAGAALLSCRLTGDVAQVQASVRPAGRLGQLGAASARARAGPAADGPAPRSPAGA